MRRHAVPIGVAVLALGLIWWTRDADDGGPVVELDTDVLDCRDNLLAIYDGLRVLSEREGQPPNNTGVAFFAELVSSGVWANDAESAGRLTCPGPGALPAPAETDYTDLPGLTPRSSAYAGRDSLNHPLSKFPSGGPEVEVLIACDNAAGSNHEGALNVLYSDRTVRTFELEKLLAAERVPAESDRILVGPDSPLEELRVLLAD